MAGISNLILWLVSNNFFLLNPLSTSALPWLSVSAILANLITAENFLSPVGLVIFPTLLQYTSILSYFTTWSRLWAVSLSSVAAPSSSSVFLAVQQYQSSGIRHVFQPLIRKLVNLSS
ncbi:hypothetical protein HOLleu_09407 [Holothuria leucospilota]|uniref:Uncharacterized protein n=1 Tax=Holothuria leucospilota TaxID=206669 RepID=A0A9Q1HB13_HOLLE|nr:hypothetical protein HOLleu_09407 [Holothuria leucospilota]